MALLGLCRPAFFEIVSGLLFLITRFLFNFFTAEDRDLVKELIVSAIGLVGMIILVIVFQLLCRNNMDKAAWVLFALLNIIGWGYLIVRIVLKILKATGILKTTKVEPKVE